MCARHRRSRSRSRRTSRRCSWEPERVLKLRKAVRLPFLDQTDPARRAELAARELALNAPHAPGLYRGLRRVTRTPDGRLALDGEGETVETLVEMAPIPPAAFLDRVAEAGGLSPALLDALADAVAAMHAAAPRQEVADPAAAFRRVLDGNLASALSAGLDPEAARRWHAPPPWRGCRPWRRRWPPARRRASSAAAMAICISAIWRCGRGGPCPSTRWNSTRR